MVTSPSQPRQICSRVLKSRMMLWKAFFIRRLDQSAMNMAEIAPNEGCVLDIQDWWWTGLSDVMSCHLKRSGERTFLQIPLWCDGSSGEMKMLTIKDLICAVLSYCAPLAVAERKHSAIVKKPSSQRREVAWLRGVCSWFIRVSWLFIFIMLGLLRNSR